MTEKLLDSGKYKNIKFIDTFNKYLIVNNQSNKSFNWLRSFTTPSVANTILAKEALSQKEDTYYVYFYDYTDEVSSVSTSIRSIKDKVYKVNTKDGFNSNYVGEDTNKDASSIEDLKVKALTLIKVENGSIVEYYEGKEEINNSFGE